MKQRRSKRPISLKSDPAAGLIDPRSRSGKKKLISVQAARKYYRGRRSG